MTTAPPDPIFYLRGHTDGINSVRFLTNERIVSGSLDGSIKFWHLSERRAMATLDRVHSDPGGVLSVVPLGNQQLLSQGRDGYIKIWDIETNKLSRDPIYIGSTTFAKAQCQRWSGSTLSRSSNEQDLIITPTENPSHAMLLDRRTSKCSHVLSTGTKNQTGMVLSLGLVSPDIAAVGYESGQLILYDIPSGGKILAEVSVFKEPLLCFDFCAEARNWFCGSSESTLKKLVMVHHQQTVTTERQDDLCQLTKGGIGEIRIRPDQRIVATGGWDKRVRIFHQNKGRPLAILKTHTETVYSVDFSPESSLGLLASGSQDSRIALWEIYPRTAR